MARELSDRLDAEGFGAYLSVFAEHEIDFDILGDLTEDDLAEMGLSIGARKRLIRAIRAYMGVPAETSTTPSAKPISPTPIENRVTAENRHMSVMFCDLVGSTALSESMEPETLREIISNFRDSCAEVIAHYEGYLANYMGDGMLIYFGYPSAHENDAERAVRTGLDMIEAVSRLDAPEGVRLQVRIGIATGYVVAGDLVGSSASESLSVLGNTPNLAARLQSVAEPDALVISDSTQRLAKTQFEYENLGKKSLKGISKPVTVWQVLGENTNYIRLGFTSSQDQTLLVGRSDVMEIFTNLWKLACDGEGQAILLSSDAGIGKSRFLNAFIETLQDSEPATVFWFGSPFNVNSPLHSVIEQMEKSACIEKHDSPEQRMEKLDRLLKPVLKDDLEALSLCAEMLNLPADNLYPPVDLAPQKKRAKTFEAILSILKEMSAHRPLLIVVEDAQWLDPSTQELLNQMVTRYREERILQVISYRPEFTPPWSGHSNITQCVLNRLNREDTIKMVTAVAGGKLLPDEVMTLILERTDGIPLFVEELTKNILNTESLREEDDLYVLTKPLNSLSIPESLHDSLLARLDSLETAKELAQIGAVCGRQFPQELIEVVSPLHRTAFEEAIEKLNGSGLVSHHGFSVDVMYEFKNALVRDAAYESLLGSRKRELHGAIAKALETDFKHMWDGQPEIIAHHFAQAKMPEKAVTYWQEAAASALDRSANREAIVHANEGLLQVADLPDGAECQAAELRLQLTLGLALMTIHGYASSGVTEAYERAAELADLLGDKARLFTATWGRWLILQQSGNTNQAALLADDVLSLAEELDDLEFRLQAHHAVWTTAYRQGNFVKCLQHAQQGAKLFDAKAHGGHSAIYGGHDPGTCAYNHAALSSWFLGHDEQSVEHIKAGVAVADHLAQPFSQALARLFGAQLYRYKDEPDQAKAYAETAIVIARANGFGQLVSQAEIVLGWAVGRQQDADDGIAIMNKAFDGLIAAGAGGRRGSFLPMLADIQLRNDDAMAALDTLDTASALMEKGGERTAESEIYLMRGIALKQAGMSGDKVHRALSKAQEMAHADGATAIERRAASLLAEL